MQWKRQHRSAPIPRRIDGESGRLHFCPRHYRRGNIPHVIGGVGMVMALVTILTAS